MQIATFKIEFFHKEEVFAQPCHHGNPNKKLVDLQRQAYLRLLVGESCQFECGGEGERPVIYLKFTGYNCGHERNNDVPECVPVWRYNTNAARNRIIKNRKTQLAKQRMTMIGTSTCHSNSQCRVSHERLGRGAQVRGLPGEEEQQNVLIVIGPADDGRR